MLKLKLMGVWGLLVGLFMVVATTTQVRAEACGNVSEEGVCQDPRTLLYCRDGELKTMACATDEICVAHEFFQGSSGCVPTRYAGCGDITDAGVCVGDFLIYCDNDQVAQVTCDQGWKCGLVSSDGGRDEYDCVSAQARAPDSAEDGEAAAPERIGAEDSAEVELGGTTDNAAPTVQRGGAAAAGDEAGGGAGCSGGGLAVGLWGLGALLARRRR